MRKIGMKHNFFFKKRIVDTKAIKSNFIKKEVKKQDFDKTKKVGSSG